MKRILLSLMILGATLAADAQLPRILLRDIDGKQVATDTLLNGGKPFVIDFFATWCKPCLRALDAIHDLYPDWQKQTGVKIYAVSIDQAQNIQKVKPLVAQKGWEYPVLLDPNSDLRRALGIQMIPYTIILDGQGRIAYKHNGYTDGDEEELYEKILEIAGKPQADAP